MFVCERHKEKWESDRGRNYEAINRKSRREGRKDRKKRQDQRVRIEAVGLSSLHSREPQTSSPTITQPFRTGRGRAAASLNQAMLEEQRRAD